MNDENSRGGLDSGVGHEASQGWRLRGRSLAWLPAWLPIPLLAMAIIAARVAGLLESYQSETLMLVLSVVFNTLVSLGTLFIIGRSFLALGTPGLLLLECGVILWSLAAPVGDAVSQGDANVAVTIFNMGILVAGVCHLAGATFSLRPQRVFRARPHWLGAGCALALGTLWLIAQAALANWLPVFFIPGQGGTPVRYCVLISAIAMFVLSAGLLFSGRRPVRNPFTSWYALALLLLAVGLFGVMIQLSLGSVVNWLGRTAQWLGGVYLLLAAVAAQRETDLPLLPSVNQSHPGHYRYGVTISIVIAAAALRFMLLPAIGTQNIFLTFYPAVILAALYGGLRAGLLAAVLSALIIDFFWMEPVRQFTLGRPNDWVRLLFFFLSCTMISFIVEAMHKARDRLILYQDHLEESVKNRTAELALEVVEHNRAEGELRESERLLAADLDAMTRLQKLGTLSAVEGNLEPVLGEVVETAMAISGADFGNIQLVNRESSDLRIVAHRGFPTWWIDFWNGVSKGQGACGAALARGERVIVEDVEQSPIFEGTPALEIQRRAGVRAVQSTPLITRSGRPLGMFSTHFKRPHRPNDRELRLLDLLARHAADLIEHKEAEEALRSKQAELELILNRTPFRLTRCSRDLRYLYASRAYAEMIGRTSEEIAGRPVKEIMGEEGFQTILPHVEAVLQGQRVEYEAEIHFTDVGPRRLQVTYIPDRDEQGRVIGWFGSIIDITERKKAEEGLAAAHRQVQSLIDNTTSIVYALDPEERFLLANTALAELLDSTPEQMIGKRRHEFMPKDDADWHEANDRQVIESGRALEFEEYSQLKGRSITWLTTKFPLRDMQGKIYAVGGISADVSERKRAEEALREGDERLKLTLQSCAVGTFEIDLTTGVGRWNAVEYELLGLRPGDAPADPETFFRYVHPQDVAELRARWEEATRTGRFDAEFRVRRADGQERWLAGKGQFAFAETADPGSAGGKRAPLRFLGVNFDITERKLAEEALRKAHDELDLRVKERTAELERKNQELQEFAFIASHDLSEPLRKVQTFGSLLEQRSADRLDEQSRDYISRMTGAANRMQELLNALLAYSRVETKGLQFRAVKMDDIVRDAVSDLEVMVGKVGACVEIGPLTSVVTGDPSQLRQLFQNLISNSLKYYRSEVPPQVHVHGEEKNGICRIFVEDNGIGFDEKYLEKIFQPFQRLHGKHEYSGIGMGLAICRKIVGRHHGTITAKSTPGKSSTFMITLPVEGTKAMNRSA